MYKNENVLVIDAGTCITYDLVNTNNQYLGGAISPGIEMRFNALNKYTGKLPLIQMRNYDGITGKTTEESILSGVLNGSINEIKETIRLYEEQYPDIKIVITGGDAKFFAKALKSSIFADPFLVLKGLNEIVDHNTPH